MTKREILKLTGLTEKEFYKLYPTKEAYEMKFGGIHSNNKMQDGGNPIVYPQQPTEDQFFNYGASYNVGIPYMEYGGPYPQQGTADEFFNFGKPAPSLNFYQTGGNVQDQIIQIIEKFAEINNIAPQNIIDELKNMGQGEQQEAIQQMLEYVQANSEQEVSQDLYGQGLTQEEYPENSPEDYTEDMTQEPQSMKMGGKKLKKYQGYNSIVNENNKKDESYLNKTSDFANWLRNTALQSNMEETMGKMQNGGTFEKTYKGRTYIVDPTTKTVIDKATGTDATKMAGLEFPDLYKSIKGAYADVATPNQLPQGYVTKGDFFDAVTGGKNNPYTIGINALNKVNTNNYSDNELYNKGYSEVVDGKLSTAAILNPSKQTINNAARGVIRENRNEIKDEYYQGVNRKQKGGLPKAQNGSNKGYRIYEGDNDQSTNTNTRSTQTVYNPNTMYNNGYDPYSYGYQPSYGYGQQAPYGYGYTTLGNPFLGLIGSLLSGPFGGNWGFDMIPFDYYGDNRNATYNNALDLRGQRRPGNQKSYLEDMQRRLDRGEGIDSDEVEIYSKLKNRFQDQRDRKENKLLRKDTRLENRNRRTTDRLVDEDNFDYYFTEDQVPFTDDPNTDNQVPDEQWDPNVNKTSKDKYNEFLQYTKDKNVKLNKKNFESVWGDWYQNRAFGGDLKKKDKFDLSNQDLNTIEEKARHKPRAFMTNPNQNALSLDVNGKPERFKDLFRAQDGAFNVADYYDPNEMYDLPEEEYYNSPMDRLPGYLSGRGPLPTGIQPTWKDIKGNSLFDKTTPKSDKRRGLLLRPRIPRADDVLNTINLTTATLNQRNQKLRERQLRTRLDDPRNLFTEGYTKKRGVWYPGPGLSYGTQDPYGLDLSGPARGYFKNGGKMAIGGPIAKDYLYLTNSMIDALSNLGGQVGYID
jgi:hypothetical protein